MTRASVVMPVYNHEAYVREAVLSVVDQTHADTELICIDDGSSDNSIGLLNPHSRRAGVVDSSSPRAMPGPTMP